MNGHFDIFDILLKPPQLFTGLFLFFFGDCQPQSKWFCIPVVLKFVAIIGLV